MDATQFEQQAEEDPQLCAFLQEVAENVAKQVPLEEPKQLDVTTTGLGILFNIVAYTLFRLAKD